MSDVRNASSGPASTGKQPPPAPPEGAPSLTEEYLTTKAAAERLGLSVEAVRAMCKGGSLSGAVRQRGHWHIPSDTVEAWRPRQSTESSSTKGSIAPTAKVASTTREKEPGPPARWQRFRNNPWVFYPATAISALIVLVGVLFALVSAGADFGGFSRQVKEWGLVREFPAGHEGETLIVIARFYHSEGVTDTEAHSEIRNAIQAAAQELGESNLRVAVSSVQIAADDRTRAERLGKQYDASIVIWGADTGARVTVNFFNLKHPDFDAAQTQITETQRTQIANPSAYASFVTRDLPDELTFLSLFAMGQSYFVSADYTRSIRVVEKAIVSGPSGATSLEGLGDAYFRLAWLYQALNENRNAIQNYDRAIELKPQQAVSYHNRGTAHYNMDEFDAAFQDCNRAIELDPQFASAYHGRGLALDHLGDLSGAMRDFDRAIELDPNFAIAYLSRGAGHHRQHDLDAAIKDYDRAIALNPRLADAYLLRASANTSRGESASARVVADLRTYLELNPAAVTREQIEQWAVSLEQQLTNP